MHNSKIKRISLAVCFALMPMAANAAGLGKLTVISGLGEPLNAEVELSASAEELSSISAQMASADAFAEQGIERASALSGVRIEVGKRPDGVPVLRMSSSQPISDPFLDMLIQVEWSSGRLLREYTALLDPPGYGDREGTTAPAATTAAGLPGTASDRISKSRRSAATPTATETAQSGDITVQKGDTLHAIAVANQVEGVSLEQMLVGLYRANKDAFAGNNMNRLKVGKIINIPTEEELQSAPQKEAVKEIRIQTADWNAYRNKLAGMVAEAAPAQETPSAQTASGKITSPAEDKSAPMPAAGPRDVVKLSKSEAGDVKGRLTALQEETTAREKAIKESSERVAALEKQLQDMQKLLEIKNKSLADAQNAGKAPTPPPPPVVAPEPPKPAEPAKVEPPKVEPAPAAEQKVEPVPPVVEAPAAEPAKLPVKKPKKIVRPAPAPAPAAEPGLFDDPLGNPLLLAGGGGLLALIGGAWFYLRNKRRKGLDSFEQGILTTGGLKPNTVFGNTAGGTVDTGNTSFLTDFGQGAAAGMIDTNDVDPIAEAEVYMAYGRDVQAEEILKDAISKEPKRYELHLKLLEIFSNRKDTGAFETLAGEIYAALGATDPTWAKVAEMGRKLEPANPLYGDSGTHVAAPKPAEPVDFDATMIQQPAAADESAGASDIGLGGLGSALDFSLDEPAAQEVASAAATSEENVLDFDIGVLELPGSEPVSAATEIETPELGADLELPMLGEDAPVAQEAEAPAAAESGGLDFSFELPEAAAVDSVQLDAADLGIGELPSLEESAAPQADESAGLSLDLPALDAVEEPVSEVPALELPAEEVAVAEADVDLALPELELPSLEEAGSEAAMESVSLDTDAGAEAESAKDEVALDLEFSTLDTMEPEVEAAPVEAVTLELPAEEPAEAEEISLDLPDEAAGGLDLDIGSEVIPESPVVEVAEVAELDESPMLDVPTVLEEQAESVPAEEAKAEAVADLDFNFDIDLGESASAPTAAAPAAAVPDLDLSGISLDMDEAGEEITLNAANESPDVDTKLDLVTAYIDMGDQEGARELLQEVLQEGGPAQRGKAQKLLDSLG